MEYFIILEILGIVISLVINAKFIINGLCAIYQFLAITGILYKISYGNTHNISKMYLELGNN